jgi:hypothetical protein
MGGRERDIWPDRVRDVATRLDGLLGELQSTVDALNSILAPPPDGQDPAAVEVPVQ